MAAVPSFAKRVLTSAARAGNALLDPTIAFSFDRTGFARHSLEFEAGDLEQDLSRKICIVTGANSGIGFETARALAERGAEVWLVCRSRARGEEACARIREATGSHDVHLEIADLSSLASVRALSERFEREHVDVLVHNAGALVDQRIETEDGLELTYATHVVGPFLLTTLLLDRLRAAKAARVITVSSGGMYAERLSVLDLGWKHRAFDGVRAYAQAKRAQVVLSELWAERLATTRITFHAMHPGWADTPGVVKGLPIFHKVTKLILRTPAQGADTVIWLAVCPRPALTSGGFWFDRKQRATHLVRKTRESDEDRAELWKRVTALAGLAEAPA